MSDQHTPKFPLYHLPPQALATVLVALGQYEQRRIELEKDNPFPAHTFCETPFGNIATLYAAETGALIKSLQHPGLDFSAIVPLFAESSEDSPYVRAARENASDGEFEIDDPAVVSKGDDAGAYVMGWMWIDDDDAGLSTYWTLQLDAEIPEGGFVIGGKLPDEPIWYFGDEYEFTEAEKLAKEIGLGYTKDIASKLPEDQEFVSDFAEFQQHAYARVARHAQS